MRNRPPKHTTKQTRETDPWGKLPVPHTSFWDTPKYSGENRNGLEVYRHDKQHIDNGCCNVSDICTFLYYHCRWNVVVSHCVASTVLGVLWGQWEKASMIWRQYSRRRARVRQCLDFGYLGDFAWLQFCPLWLRQWFETFIWLNPCLLTSCKMDSIQRNDVRFDTYRWFLMSVVYQWLFGNWFRSEVPSLKDPHRVNLSPGWCHHEESA